MLPRCGSGTGTSCAVTLTGVVSGHGLLIGFDSGNLTSVTDSDAGDTVTDDVDENTSHGSHLYRVSSSVGGSVTITVNQSSSAYCTLKVSEMSTAISLDSSSKNSASGTASGTTYSLAVTTSARANEFIYSYATTTGDCLSVASLFTLISQNGGDCAAYDSVSSTGTYTATYTDSTSGATYAIVGAGYYTTVRRHRAIIIRH